MSGPTGPVRDSSLQDRKAPGVFIRRTPQPRLDNVVAVGQIIIAIILGERYPIPTPSPTSVEAARDVLDTLGGGIERRRDAVWVAWARSREATRASCSAVSSSSRRRMRLIASNSSSPIVSAAITISRMSPIAPKFFSFSCSTRWSRSLASVVELVFLSRLAGHAVLSAVDDDVHMRHCLRLDHRTDAVDRDIEALRDIAVGGFRAGANARSRRRAPRRASNGRCPERLHLRGERASLRSALAAALDRRLPMHRGPLQAAAWRLRSRSRQSSPPHRRTPAAGPARATEIP